MNDQIDPFRAIEIGNRAHALQAAGRSIIHMEFGQPTVQPPRIARDAAKACIDQGVPGYWESPALIDRIAGLYRDRYGLRLAPERIILTCGASPALVLTLTSCFAPGDVITTGRPGYVAYRNTVRGLGLVMHEVPCGPDTGFQLTAEMIEQLDPAPAGVIIASPANPTGSIIPPAHLSAIAAVCQSRGIRLIADEIYHGLSFGEDTVTAAALDENAAIINSFSKYFAMPGWRIGWLVAPADLVEAARARVGNFFLTAPSISQTAALAAFDATDELDSHVAVYKQNRDTLVRALSEIGIGRVAPPDGAFYVYADVSDWTSDSVAFCLALLEDTGVATAPGVDFDPVDGGRFMRFSFAITAEECADAIARIRPWFAARRSM